MLPFGCHRPNSPLVVLSSTRSIFTWGRSRFEKECPKNGCGAQEILERRISSKPHVGNHLTRKETVVE